MRAVYYRHGRRTNNTHRNRINLRISNVPTYTNIRIIDTHTENMKISTRHTNQKANQFQFGVRICNDIVVLVVLMVCESGLRGTCRAERTLCMYDIPIELNSLSIRRRKRMLQLCVETTICKWRLLFAGAIQWTNTERLTRRVMFETVACGENPGPGRPEMNWACVWWTTPGWFDPLRDLRKVPLWCSV